MVLGAGSRFGGFIRDVFWNLASVSFRQIQILNLRWPDVSQGFFLKMQASHRRRPFKSNRSADATDLLSHAFKIGSSNFTFELPCEYLWKRNTCFEIQNIAYAVVPISESRAEGMWLGVSAFKAWGLGFGVWGCRFTEFGVWGFRFAEFGVWKFRLTEFGVWGFRLTEFGVWGFVRPTAMQWLQRY